MTVQLPSRAVIIAPAIAVLAAMMAGPPAAQAAKVRRCGSVGNRSDTGAAIGIRALRISCARARRVLKGCVNNGRAPGWHLSRTGRLITPSNTAEVLMTKGRAKIWAGYVGGSKTCYPPY